jgi:hypothetical protein
MWMGLTYSGRAKDLDGDEVGLLGNTVSRSTDGASNVSTVASIVDVRTTDKVFAERGTTTEFFVVDVDARVNNIAKSSCAGCGIVVVSVGSVVALRDTAKTPCTASLRSDGIHVDGEIFLNNGDLEV